MDLPGDSYIELKVGYLHEHRTEIIYTERAEILNTNFPYYFQIDVEDDLIIKNRDLHFMSIVIVGDKPAFWGTERVEYLGDQNDIHIAMKIPD